MAEQQQPQQRNNLHPAGASLPRRGAAHPTSNTTPDGRRGQGATGTPTSAAPTSSTAPQCRFCPVVLDDKKHTTQCYHFKDNRTLDGYRVLGAFNPCCKQHIIVVPKNQDHNGNSFKNHTVIGKAVDAAVQAAQDLFTDDKGRERGVNIVLQLGALGKDHLVVHMIPRRDNDGISLPWTGQKQGFYSDGGPNADCYLPREDFTPVPSTRR